MSDVLDKNVDKRFYLSSAACQSILKRAEDSNKEIPPILKNALEQQSQNIEKDFKIENSKVYSLSSKGSNAMKSDNPHSGFSEVDVFRTIDTNGGNPICNQGGNVIVEFIAFAQNQRNEVRDLGNKSATIPVMYTKNQTHILEDNYIIRKLTPTECAKLQGFPVDWCNNLEETNITEEKIQKWKKIIDDFNKINNPNAKEKNEQQVKKWLENPYSDSAEYKLWGNGIALPCVNYIMDELVDFLNE